MCNDSLIADARIGYYERAKEVGEISPGPFPEDMVKNVLTNLCTCIAKQASFTWSFNEFIKNKEKNMGLITEFSVSSSACKPKFQ